MASKAEDSRSIAMFLYEEHRVEHCVQTGRRAYLPMWHELPDDEQRPWVNKARRLQDHLRMTRSLARYVKSAS